MSRANAAAMLMLGTTVTDPDFALVAGLWHFDFITTIIVPVFPDSSANGNNLTLGGPPTVDTSNFKFGPGSMLNGSGAGAQVISAGFTFGTGDFCVESFFYPTNLAAGYECLWDAEGGGASIRCYPSFNGDGNIQIYVGGTLLQGGACTANAWNHCITSRVSGRTYLGLNGAEQGTPGGVADTNNYTATTFTVGNWNGFSQALIGNVDETRATVGSGRGYVGGSYIVPTAPYPNS